ncbi:Cytochrome P450 82A3 [Vitis vinifera]|uniref:Cytochrome P450 82A3 n=1 Tax=Vitis vinifera TaxID=29760 RepID=A0A438K115_VITVI|nr:Cytochrome P450 82A3 [Vitis vinifera]
MDFLLQCLTLVMVGAFAILVLSYHLLLWRTGAGKSRMAPEASGAWPIIVFSIRLGLKRAVVVNSWEMAKECFTTHDLALASRPEVEAAKYLGYNYAMFAFSPHGAYWREVRTIQALAEKKNEAGVVLVDMKEMVWALDSERDSYDGCWKTIFRLYRRKDITDYDADTINKATALILIGGGTDTTSATLTWVISLLLNNPDVLRKAQEELDAHVGTRLILNLTKIQRDPRVWLNPMEFQPDRFLTTHKDVDVRGKQFELTPFGGGRRICPGAVFALQVLHLTLANFLHRFQLSTPSDAPVDMSESFGLTNIKSTPLEVLISPRLASYDLYE